MNDLDDIDETIKEYIESVGFCDTTFMWRAQLLVYYRAKLGSLKAAAKFLNLDHDMKAVYRLIEKCGGFKKILETFMTNTDTAALAQNLAWKKSKLKLTVERSMPEILTEESKELYNPTATISAISELNKMEGDYATTKTQVDSNVNVDMKEISELIDKYARDY